MLHSHHRPWRDRIAVGGFQPFSTVDWPDRLAAVVFLRGCPWRCGYCHNPHLQTREGISPVVWADIEAELERRRGWIDGVVFSGGEPTVDSALPEAVRAVRSMGYRVGLHTGGSYPERLAALLPLLDWVGLDFKTAPSEYDALTGTPGSGNKACYSAHLVASSGVDHEFRLTYHSALIGEGSLLKAADYAAALGCRHFVLQEYRPVASLVEVPHLGIAQPLLDELAQRFPRFSVRQAS